MTNVPGVTSNVDGKYAVGKSTGDMWIETEWG